MVWWTSGCGRIELQITKAQSSEAAHTGQCNTSVRELSELPKIKRQLKRVDPETLKAHLREYGAWDEDELLDHEQNLQRLLWLACGDINEGSC